MKKNRWPRVVTYVARNLEPYRAFHSFMRALPAIQAEHKTCHMVIVGRDEVSYGSRPKDPRYKNWSEQMLAEVGSRLDPMRTHFVGELAYADYKRLLQVSAAHVYLTYPCVLSWSCLEAMASGCLVIGSDTAPVREVLKDGVSGVMLPFGEARQLTELIAHGLAERRDGMRAEARRTVRSRFARDSGETKFLSGVAPWVRA